MNWVNIKKGAHKKKTEPNRTELNSTELNRTESWGGGFFFLVRFGLGKTWSDRQPKRYKRVLKKKYDYIKNYRSISYTYFFLFSANGNLMEQKQQNRREKGLFRAVILQPHQCL